MTSVSPKVEAALTRFKERLTAEFEGRLRKLVLFGSVARGEARWDSDVDVLVLVDALLAQERRHIIDLAADELTDHDVLVSPTVMTPEEFARMRERERLLPREIDRDGVVL